MASGLAALHMPSVQDYLIQEEVLTRDQVDNFPLLQHLPLSGCHVPQSLCRKVGEEVHTAFVSEVWLSSLSMCCMWEETGEAHMLASPSWPTPFDKTC